jgi:hypothetical protein
MTYNFVPLKIPPGMSRPGTVYDAKGRWYDGNLVRWYEGAMQAIGGWQKMTNSSDVDRTTGAVTRSLFAWRMNDNTPVLAAGYSGGIYILKADTFTDVTLTGLSAGANNTTTYTSSGSLYNTGIYGYGFYGKGNEAITIATESTVWQFDAFGEDLVAVAKHDGKLWYIDMTGVTAANWTSANSAPANNASVVVTPENFIMCLGAENDGRRVQWNDQTDSTDWVTTDPTNQAGFFLLGSPGKLMTGKAARNETLLWTDLDLWSARYIGGSLVYSFQRLGNHCGAISRNCVGMVDGTAFWMGPRGFFMYDGYVRNVPSEVGDYVFEGLNVNQYNMVTCVPNSTFGEVTWYYPHDSSENNRYVTYNYRDNFWILGALERTAGVDRGAFQYPIAVDASGALYEHEVGTSYLDTDDATEVIVYAESGPFELGNGSDTMVLQEYIPDSRTLGDLAMVIFHSLYPTADETTSATFTAANPTNMRINARQIRLKILQADGREGLWRFGTPRIDVAKGSQR